jgi:hypothetical protein
MKYGTIFESFTESLYHIPVISQKLKFWSKASTVSKKILFKYFLFNETNEMNESFINQSICLSKRRLWVTKLE